MTRKKASRKGLGRPKTPSKSSQAVVQVVPSHGHGLLNVGNPGNVGNVRATGRPRDEVRRAATEALRKGPGVLERIMDGQTIVTLTEKCPKCGHEPEGSTLALPVQVKPAEQVRAVEALDKLAGEDRAIGLVDEAVQQRVVRTYEEIRFADYLTDEQKARLLAGVGRHWRDDG